MSSHDQRSPQEISWLLNFSLSIFNSVHRGSFVLAGPGLDCHSLAGAAINGYRDDKLHRDDKLRQIRIFFAVKQKGI